MVQNDNELVLAMTYETVWQAEMAKDILSEYNILAIINDQIFGTLYPMGIRLLVRQKDLSKTMEILAKAEI